MQSFDILYMIWQGVGLLLGFVLFMILFWRLLRTLDKPKDLVSWVRHFPYLFLIPFIMSYLIPIIASAVFYPSMAEAVLIQSTIPLVLLLVGVGLLYYYFSKLVPNEMEFASNGFEERGQEWDS